MKHTDWIVKVGVIIYNAESPGEDYKGKSKQEVEERDVGGASGGEPCVVGFRGWKQPALINTSLLLAYPVPLTHA
jgi:hypothetical protein